MLKSKHTKPLQAVISILIPMTLCTLATTSYADNLSTNAPITGKAAKTNDSLPILYCPPVNTIKRSNDYIWTAKVEGGWKSTDPSFAKHLTRFMGAQWQGVGTGNIVCFYQAGRTSNSFYVQLSYSILTKDPVISRALIMQHLITPNNWVKKTTGQGEDEQTIMSCSSSNDIHSCPFLPGQIIRKQDPEKMLSTTKQDYHPLSTPNL